jgi:hypothetical protein
MLLRLAVFALAVSFTAHALADTTKNTMYEMDAIGEVQIATDGSVSDYRLHSKLTPLIASLVDRGVRAWHFEPVLVDGKPVVAKTAMRLHLRCTPVDADNYKIEVANVIFGEPRKQDHVEPPRYPDTAVRSHVGARVLIYVKLDEEGRVVEAEPYQTSLDVRTRSEFEANSFRKLFEAASVRAARNWRYDLTETVNGKKMGTVAIVPIVYNVRAFGTRPVQDGEWKGYVPGPIHDSPLGSEAKIGDGAKFADLGDGEAQPLNSRFKLRDDVIGKPL